MLKEKVKSGVQRIGAAGATRRGVLLAPDQRRRVRQDQALPRLAPFKLWMYQTLSATSAKSAPARHLLLAPVVGSTHALRQ